MSSTKRRKISNDDSEDTATTVVSPPSVVSSAFISTAPAPAVELVEPELAEIPKLVLVGLHQEDPDDVIEAMKRLYELTNADRPNGDGKKKQLDAVLSGAAGAVVRVLRKWQMNEGIQENACRCLLRLAYKSNEGKRSVAIVGGLVAAVNAMRALPQSQGVNSAACCVIRNIVQGWDGVDAVCHRFLEALNGMELCVHTMKKFPNHASMQLSCCLILEKLLKKTNSREAMKKAGVLVAVATAMENHLEDAAVQKDGGRLLKAIS